MADTPQAARRITLPPGLGDEILERAAYNGRTVSKEVAVMLRAALAEEARPPRPPDGPLQRRIEVLMGEDRQLTREMAERIARQGGHDE